MNEVMAGDAVESGSAHGARLDDGIVVYRAGEDVPQSELTDLGPPANLGASVLDGDPRISARTDYASGQLLAGVFQSTPGKVLIHFPFTEYATILNGEVELCDQWGNRCTLGPGDSYFIRQGSVVGWDVRDAAVQKTFFYRIEPEPAPAPIRVYRAHGEVAQEELAPLGEPEALGGSVLSGQPDIAARFDFGDGSLTAGVFQAMPADVRIRFPFTELATVAVGTVTLTDGAGRAQCLQPGDTYLVRQGTSVLWQVTGRPLQKSFVNIVEAG